MINADLNAQSQFQDFLAATEAGAAALGLAHGRDGPSPLVRMRPERCGVGGERAAVAGRAGGGRQDRAGQL